MNIYNSILTFSNDFKNCDEVKEFKKLKKKIDENAEKNGEDVVEKEKQLNDLNAILMSNSEISEYMAAEVRISTIMNDIVKMLEETIAE